MNDDAAALLDRLTSGLPDPGPPVGLLAEGRRRVRRRRRARLSAGLAAVVVAVAGAAVVPQLVGSGDRPAPTDRPDAVLPAPPEGTRWVGHGDVVLAVPEEWSTGAEGCNQPLSDTVFRHDDLLDFAACVSPRVSYASSLELYLGDPPRMGELRDGELHCAEPRIPTCRGQVRVPDQGVVFAVTTHGADAGAVASAILESVTRLPDGWTAVAWPERPFPNTTVPAPGTPVRVGSAVRTVERPPPAPMLVDQAVALPGQAVGLLFPTEAMRGIGYTLAAEDGTTYFLTASTDPRAEPAWSTEAGWDDVGVNGPGPDRIVVPDVATPGRYRICTANAADRMCTAITVTE